MSQEWSDRATDKTNCSCSFCIAMWQQMDRADMKAVAWQMYEFHLEAKHGWTRKDIEP